MFYLLVVLKTYFYFFSPSGLDGDNLLDKARVDEIVEYLVEVKTAGFKVLFAPTDPVNMIGYFVFWFSKKSACHKYGYVDKNLMNEQRCSLFL